MGCATQRSENPDAGCHLDRPKSDLEAKMRSGSINAICVTFGDFTIPGDFRNRGKRLMLAKIRRRNAFNGP
jgi:hypothetical protein